MRNVGTLWRATGGLKGQTRYSEALETDGSGKPFPPLESRGTDGEEEKRWSLAAGTVHARG